MYLTEAEPRKDREILPKRCHVSFARTPTTMHRGAHRTPSSGRTQATSNRTSPDFHELDVVTSGPNALELIPDPPTFESQNPPRIGRSPGIGRARILAACCRKRAGLAGSSWLHSRIMRLLTAVAAATAFLPPLSMAATRQNSSLCDQLAARAHQASAVTWKSGQWLQPWVAVSKAIDRRWGANEGAVYDLLKSEFARRWGFEGPFVLELEHLPRTRVYMGFNVSGVLDCQNSLFAAIGIDGSAHALPAPGGYTAPCQSVSGNLGSAFGRPAYIETGTLSSTTDDALTRIAPWTGRGWGPICKLTVHFNYELELKRQFCADRSTCGAGRAVAIDVAREYLSYIRLRPDPPTTLVGDKLVPAFSLSPHATGGRQGTVVVARAWRIVGRQGAPYQFDVSEFPTFGFHTVNDAWRYSFSYVDFAIFPLMLSGHVYVGAVGHNGFAWREGKHILFAVYEAPAHGQIRLTPISGFVVDRAPISIKKIIVRDSAAPAPVARGQ